MEAVIRATEHNRALPPTQTGARVYCPKGGFTREKKADKLRLRALSGGDSQSDPIPRRATEATLEEPAEVAKDGVAWLLGDRLHGAHPALQQWQAHFSPHIIDQIRKTTGQLTLERRLQGALIAIEDQHNPQRIGNRLSSLDQGRHDATIPVILRLGELQ